MEICMDLGDQIDRRLNRGVNAQGATAKEIWMDVRSALKALRNEWAGHKSQLSVRARTSV
jgi:hypothetical protein